MYTRPLSFLCILYCFTLRFLGTLRTKFVALIEFALWQLPPLTFSHFAVQKSKMSQGLRVLSRHFSSTAARRSTVKHVTIIGSGLMGSGIAQVLRVYRLPKRMGKGAKVEICNVVNFTTLLSIF